MSETFTFTLCPVCGVILDDGRANSDHDFPVARFEHTFCVDSGIVTRDVDGEVMWFVNVYEVDRCYGGPEEGGWYYDAGQLLATYAVSGQYGDAQALRERLRNDEWANIGHASSVAYRGGQFELEITRGAPAPAFYPEGIPHYE